jgi:hypothetical protein
MPEVDLTKGDWIRNPYHGLVADVRDHLEPAAQRVHEAP